MGHGMWMSVKYFLQKVLLRDNLLLRVLASVSIHSFKMVTSKNAISSRVLEVK